MVTFQLNTSSFSSIQITSKQAIDLRAHLNGINVRMPTDSTFIRTISRFNDDTLSMITLLNNFHSMQWSLTLRNGAIVTAVTLVSLLHRYGDFSTLRDTFSQGTRYVGFTYLGQDHFMHAVYDLQDCFHSADTLDNFSNCYIM